MSLSIQHKGGPSTQRQPCWLQFESACRLTPGGGGVVVTIGGGGGGGGGGGVGSSEDEEDNESGAST